MTKKLTKRFVSFVVTLAMVMAVLPIIPAMAAAEPVTDVTEFAQVFDPDYTAGETSEIVSVDGNTVTLLGDVEIATKDDRPVIKSGEYTLDLNGNKLSIADAVETGTAVIRVEGGSLTIVDGDPATPAKGITGGIIAAGGTLTFGDGAAVTKAADEGFAAIGGHYGSTINVTGTAALSGVGTLIATNGELNITGGTITSTEETADRNATITIGGTKGESAADKPAVATISGGEITGDVAVFAYGDLTVEGTAVINNQNGYAIGTNGSESGDNASTGAKITINGGTITGADDACGIYAPAGAWAIKDGTISGGAGIVVRGGKVAVTGGTIKATGDAESKIQVGDATVDGEKVSLPASGIVYDDAEYPEDKTDDGVAAVTVSGNATVESTAEDVTSVSYTEKGKVPSEEKETTIEIVGGTFTANGEADTDTVKKFVPDNYTMDDNTGEITPTNGIADYPVELNGFRYETLAAAVEAVGENGVGTITLLDDVELPGTGKDNRLTIEKRKITLDLGGFTLSRPETFEGNTSALVVGNGGDLTIVDSTEDAEAKGSIEGKDKLLMATAGGTITLDKGVKIIQADDEDGKNDSAVAASDGTLNIKDAYITAAESAVGVFGKGKLNVTGGTIDAEQFGISTNGSQTEPEAKITITGGDISSTSSAGVYLPNGGMTVSGEGTIISGLAGIVVRGGDLTVEGGKIISTAEDDTTIDVGDGDNKTVKPGAVVVNDKDDDDSSAYGAPALNVTGGTFATKSEKVPTINYEAAATAEDKEENKPVTVEGGTFTKGEGENAVPDVAVSKYMDATKGFDNGAIKPANEVTLQIIDFGYIDKMNDDGVNAAAKASGKFTSPAGIVYTCTDWADATFYWSFNRALEEGETVTVTFTAPDGETTYTDTCENAKGFMRFATSFLNGTQLGDDDVEGFQTGEYTIGGSVKKGTETTDVTAIKGAETATVNDLLPSIAEGAPVVAKATIGDKNGDIKDIVGDYDVKCSAQDSDGNYVIKGTAKDLKSHTNGNGTEGYWFGVEIVAPKDVTLGNNYGLTIDQQAPNPEVPVATNINGVPDAKGASIFFNTKGDGKETHTVKIKWDNDHEVTYIIDLTGVEHYVEPAPTVGVATIADKDGDITDVVTDPKVKYEGDKIVGTATDLKKHTNGNNDEGNWFGITIEAPSDLTAKATAGTYTVTFGDNNTKAPEEYTTLTSGEKGAVIYFNVKDNETAPHTLKIKWSDSKEITYNVDLTGVKLYKEPAPTVAAAPIVDKSTTPVTDVVDNGYKAEYDATSNSIKGTATNLKKHENDNNEKAYWFGVEIQAPTDVVVKGDKIDVTIDTNATVQADYEALPTAGGKGVIIYFKSTGKADDKHTVTVKWGATSKTLKYDIDLSNVKHFVEAPTVNVGNTTEGTASTDYKATVDATYTDKTTYKYAKVTFTTDTDKKVPYGANGAGTNGNWVGITVAPPEGSTITGLATAAAETPIPTTFAAPTGDDSAQLSGYYVDASKDITNKFFFVEITDASGAKTVYCYELTKGTPLELEAAPVTKYTVTIDGAIANGTVTAEPNTDVAADTEVTVTVTPETGYKCTGVTVTPETEGVTAPEVTAGAQENTYTFTMPASNVTVTATFVAEEVPVTKYTVTCETATGGTVKADKTTAAENETVTLTVTANSGYRFSSVTVKDAEGNTVTTTAGTSGKYTFTMPASNVTVTAAFRKTGSSSSGGGGGSSTHSVSTPSKTDNGSVKVSSKSASKGSKVTITVKPDEGYKTGSVVVKDAKGNLIDVTDNGDGTYSFVMPDTKVSIETEFVPEGTATPSPEATPAPEQTPAPDAEDNCPSEKFVDVDQSLWYHEGIDYALTNGLMSGMDETTFEPDSTTTRAMIVSVLYRLDGSPEVAEASFTDVPEGAWYADAVAWGEASGVVSGYDAETFGPEDYITREQMASILYRYAQYKGIDVSAQADLSGYYDAALVSDWANTSLSWANAAGIVSGMSDIELAPTATATRAQVASILMRFCENIVK